MDLQTDAVLRVLQEGLQDRQSIEVGLFSTTCVLQIHLIFAIGPACGSSRLCILFYLL
jgi:hypothetical protein